MREYTNKITLSKNSRGIYSLDPSMGCNSGTAESPMGCYSDCYAARYSKRYGYNFSKTILRHFENESHKHSIIRQIEKIDMPFIRMGTSGDPSENWEHTLGVCKSISTNYQLNLFKQRRKEIVIITKHWSSLTDDQLEEIFNYNVCINTSVSALDNPDLLNKGLKEYERIKPFCKSILRIVSCDFNLSNEKGRKLAMIQDAIFKKYNALDTILRVSKDNQYVLDGLINIKKTKFLGKKCYVSKYNKKTFFGKCKSCPEMCGLTIGVFRKRERIN